MSDAPEWLPEALRYSNFNGDWDKFLVAIYEIFDHDFKQSRPSYKGHPVTYDSRIENGKEVVFWHLIQGGKEPDLRRAERIPWLKPVIENCTDKAISVWRNKRVRKKGAKQTRILIWLEGLDYLVVLAEMRRVIVLVTAYYIDSNHQRRKLRKERDEYYGIQKPPFQTV